MLISETTRKGPHCSSTCDITGSDWMSVTSPTNRLRAELSYTTKLPKTDWWGAQQFTFGVVGDNLLNEDIRNAVAYNKDQVLMPGLGVRIFANVKY